MPFEDKIRNERVHKHECRQYFMNVVVVVVVVVVFTKAESICKFASHISDIKNF